MKSRDPAANSYPDSTHQTPDFDTNRFPPALLVYIDSQLRVVPGSKMETEMDVIKQNIAEIDSAIIEARQWLKEAKTDQDVEDRRAQLDSLEADLVAEQAKLDAMILEEETKRE